jgi:hypothetical protein
MTPDQPAIDAEVEADPPCTDYGDTGITFQTERRCACQPPLPATEPPGEVEAITAGDVEMAAAIRAMSVVEGRDGE